MGDILAQIFAALLSFFPRRVIVRSTHGGVRFKHGRVAGIEPGTAWYWPLFTEVEVIDVAPGPMEIEPQALMDAQHAAVLVSPVVRYRITDVVRALGRRLDIETIIEDHVSAAVAEEMSELEIAEVMDDWEGLGESITKRCNAELLEDGVQILWVGFREFAPARTLRHIGVRLG